MKTEDGKRWRKRSWLHSLVSCFPSTESITLMNEPANPPERKRKKRHHHHLHHNNKSNIFLLPIFHLNNDIILFHTHIFMSFISFLISFFGIVVGPTGNSGSSCCCCCCLSIGLSVRKCQVSTDYKVKEAENNKQKKRRRRRKDEMAIIQQRSNNIRHAPTTTSKRVL